MSSLSNEASSEWQILDGMEIGSRRPWMTKAQQENVFAELKFQKGKDLSSFKDPARWIQERIFGR